MGTKAPTFETPFDTYHVVRKIGEGGSGRVYQVTNLSGEVFALKALSPERVTSERLKRFKNEIAFCQRNLHHNIVAVIDTGVSLTKGVKCPFYVMKCYSETLRTRIAGMAPDDALNVFSKILDGVEAAHLLGVWHRDLKPENVLCGERGDLVVADFGIAHFEVEDIYTAVETRHAARLANFLYSAPEQRVRGARVDARADIFSLGLMLNELFTRTVPQGSGFKRISDAAPAFAYVDEIVESMIQQLPNSRPASIAEIKKNLIGHRNAFVALQHLEETKRTVVSSATPPEFDPISIVGLDYSGKLLILKLSRNVPPGWVQEFQQPRGGHSAIVGYGPERFQIRGDTAGIVVDENERIIQQLVENAKGYVAGANRGYLMQLREIADQQERGLRSDLERRVREAEMRNNILRNVKL